MRKPFDFEAAKRGEPFETAEGAPRYFVGINPKRPGYFIATDEEGFVLINPISGCSKDGTCVLFMSTKKRAIEFAVLEYSNRDRPYRVLVPVDEVDAWAGKDTDQRVTVEIEE